MAVSWQTPKTDWTSEQQGVDNDDFNRIEGNTQFLHENTPFVQEQDKHYFLITSIGTFEAGDTADPNHCVEVYSYVSQRKFVNDVGNDRVSRVIVMKDTTVSLKAGEYGLVNGGDVHIYLCDENYVIENSKFMSNSVVSVHYDMQLTGGLYKALPAVFVPWYIYNSSPSSATHLILYGRITNFTSGVNDQALTFNCSSNIVNLGKISHESFEGII